MQIPDPRRPRRVVQWAYEYNDTGSCISDGANHAIGVRLLTEAGSFLCESRLDLGDQAVYFQ
jgi:hypothetical protein